MMLMEDNYQAEREAREKRLAAYSEKIQEYTLEHAKQVINELVAERHRQNMTQQAHAQGDRYNKKKIK